MSNMTPSQEERKEIDRLKSLITEKGDIVHINDLEEVNLSPSYSLPREAPGIKCPFCNAEWIPKMVNIIEAMGYCDYCYDTSSVNFIACSKCGKIVYSK